MLAALLASALAAPGAAGGLVELPAWRRTPLTPIPERSCQELVIAARGTGPLEVRFPLAALPETGRDLRGSGAALWISAREDAPVTLSVLHPAALPSRAYAGVAALRWIRDGSRLCFASASEPLACADTRAPVAGSQRIAFGPGWRTQLRGCAELAVTPGTGAADVARAALAGGLVLGCLWLLLRRRGWLLALAPAVLVAGLACMPGLWLDPRVGAAAAGWSLVMATLSGVRRRARVALLALATAAWLAWLPMPLRTAVSAGPGAVREVSLPDAAALWTDPAWWNPFALHHRLGFRERPVAELLTQPAAGAAVETWLVAGGSVTHGIEVGPGETFTAVAERALRAQGRPIRLLNAGVPAWTLGQLDRVLEELTADLPLHGIVVASVLNNAAFALPGPLPAGCNATALASLACGLGRGPGHLAWAKYALPKPGNAERYAETLRRLIQRESARGRRVVLLDETSRWQLTGSARDARDARYRAVARSEARRAGLTLHGLEAALAGIPESELLADAIHLSATGHEAVGRHLAGILAAIPPPAGGGPRWSAGSSRDPGSCRDPGSSRGTGSSRDPGSSRGTR